MPQRPGIAYRQPGTMEAAAGTNVCLCREWMAQQHPGQSPRYIYRQPSGGRMEAAAGDDSLSVPGMDGTAFPRGYHLTLNYCYLSNQ